MFPLYTSIQTRIADMENVEIKKEERQKFLKGVNKLDSDGQHKLCALILYDIKMAPNVQNGQMEFDFYQLSNRLQRICCAFVQLHLQVMKENEQTLRAEANGRKKRKKSPPPTPVDDIPIEIEVDEGQTIEEEDEELPPED